VEKYGTAGQTTDVNIRWCMRIAYWIPKVTNTLSEYRTLNAFLRQPWLRQSASLLRYAYITCVVYGNCYLHLTHSVNIVINRTVNSLADKCNLSAEKETLNFLCVVRFN
jgi:hypothetical protein